MKHTLLWAILQWLPCPLEGVSHSQSTLVRYTSRALFCQSVVHDELEDRCHGCGIELLPATGNENGPTHGFFLFASLNTLTGVQVVVELSISTLSIRDARRMNKCKNCKARKEMVINVQGIKLILYHPWLASQSESEGIYSQGRKELNMTGATEIW